MIRRLIRTVIDTKTQLPRQKKKQTCSRRVAGEAESDLGRLRPGRPGRLYRSDKAVPPHKTLPHVPGVTSAEGFPAPYQRVRALPRLAGATLRLPLSSLGSSSTSGPSPSPPSVEPPPPQPERPPAPSPPRHALFLRWRDPRFVPSLFLVILPDRCTFWGANVHRDDAPDWEYKHGERRRPRHAWHVARRR